MWKPSKLGSWIKSSALTTFTKPLKSALWGFANPPPREFADAFTGPAEARLFARGANYPLSHWRTDSCAVFFLCSGSTRRGQPHRWSDGNRSAGGRKGSPIRKAGPQYAVSRERRGALWTIRSRRNPSFRAAQHADGSAGR